MDKDKTTTTPEDSADYEPILELLTPEELAAELRVPVSWVYSRTRVDALPCIRVGKYVRFRLDAVLDHLAAK